MFKKSIQHNGSERCDDRFFSTMIDHDEQAVGPLASATRLMLFCSCRWRLAESNRQTVHSAWREGDSLGICWNQPSLFNQLLSGRFEVGA